MIEVNLDSLTPEVWSGLDNRAKDAYVATALGWTSMGSQDDVVMWIEKKASGATVWGDGFCSSWDGFGRLVKECARRGWRLEFEELSFREAKYWRCSAYLPDGDIVDSETESELPSALALTFCLAVIQEAIENTGDAP